MRFALVSLFFVGTALASKAPKLFSPDIKEFEKANNVFINPDDINTAEENLKKAVEQINDNNKKFAKGESSFEETLYPETILDEKEFAKEEEGRIPVTARKTKLRNFGRINYPDLYPTKEENDAVLARIDAELDRSALPRSYDARKKGIVTPPKTQTGCGACSAFAATANHESCMLHAGAPRKGLDLSEQYIIDCGYNGETMNGCNGGGPWHYTEWFITKGEGTSPHENSMPYLFANPRKYCPKGIVKYDTGAKVVSFDKVKNAGIDRLKALLIEHGTINIGLFAYDKSFENYKSGVFQGCSKGAGKQDHQIQLIGYGHDSASGLDYWLAKNSWGTNWGENGFFRLKMGNDECGLESDFAMWTKCQKTGPGAATQPPKSVTPAPVKSAKCDISKMYGPNVNGEYNLMYHGEEKVIKCVNSVCVVPKAGSSVNACNAICKNPKCEGNNDGSNDNDDNHNGGEDNDDNHNGGNDNDNNDNGDYYDDDNHNGASDNDNNDNDNGEYYDDDNDNEDYYD